MSVFRDNSGNEWIVRLDAFVLADVKKETGVDLADISAGGWQAIETDAGAVGRVLAVVCRDEMQSIKVDARTFARSIRGEAIESGRKALLDEGADFFPASEWSAIRSNLEKRRQMAGLNVVDLETATKILPMAEAFMRLDKMTQEALIAEASTSSPTLPAGGSVSGQDVIQSSVVTDSPGSAE